MLMIALRVVAFAIGVYLALWVLISAIRTMVVPRGQQVSLSRWVFLADASLFRTLATKRRTAEGRANVLAGFAPTSLIVLAVVWAVLEIAAFVLLFWALDRHTFVESIYLSGSSITTLGFVQPNGSFENLLAVAEALLGLGLVALLISYLPTIYGLFSSREKEVLKLDVRAGSPPSAVTMLVRFHQIGWLDNLDETWSAWEDWFSEVEESHTSHPALVLFRSQRSNSSWITCAGAVLDTASLSLSLLDMENNPRAAVTIRSGFMCLRAIADFYMVPFDHNPPPDAPISIYRQEFDILFDELAMAGLPMVADRDAAWQRFRGWRVNYDVPLLALCCVAAAPATPWSADRIENFHNPHLFNRRWIVPPFETE
jgi:hypothetical protein